jgi:hypothetical protein
MTSQMTYTKAMQLGPFLTLILLSSSRRGRAISENLRLLSDELPALACDSPGQREEVFNPSEPAPRSAVTMGPLLTLILTSGRSQPQAGGK